MQPYMNYSSQIPMQAMNSQAELLQRQVANLQNQLAQTQAQYQQMASQQQMPTIQQNQMGQQSGTGLTTYIVENFDNITANSVPMDNNGALFVKQDGSEIQLRKWSADGTITPTSYFPQNSPQKENAENLPPNNSELKIGLNDETTQALMDRFDTITNMIDALNQNISQLKPQTRVRATKKEADSE